MGKEESKKEGIQAYAPEKGVAVGSRTLCCLIFYALAMQSLLSWFGGEVRIAHLRKLVEDPVKIVTLDWVGILVALTALLFYTKIIIDDQKNKGEDVKISIPFYCFAWIAFVFQSEVLKSSHQLSILSFVVGICVLTVGMLKDKAPQDGKNQKDMVMVNAICEVLFGIGSIFLNMEDRLFNSGCCKGVAIGLLFSAFIIVVLDMTGLFVVRDKKEAREVVEVDLDSKVPAEFKTKTTTSSR